MTLASYTGKEYQDLPGPSGRGPADASAVTKIALFVFFVLTRAVHPAIIDASKTENEFGKKTFAYGAQTVNVAEVVISMAIAQLVALCRGGVAEWRSIWHPEPMKIFSFCGFMYALGDYLEMKSMVSLTGGAYQILLQSKLLITALMSWGIKGTGQTLLQWNILAIVMLSMCVYMCMGDVSQAGGGQALLGAFNVLLKNFVSCLASVLTDKYTKKFNHEPVYVQAVQLRCARLVTLIVLIMLDGQTLQSGFFYGWDVCTTGVLLSFMLKAWSSLYLLSVLDSVMKNIGEAMAVLVIYFMEVALPVFEAAFQLPSFFAVLVVVLSVSAYISSKGVVDKAKKYDVRSSAR